MTKHGELKCDEKILQALKRRVRNFLKKYPDAQFNPKWETEHFLRNTAKLGGRCPCDHTRPKCPCEQAPDELVSMGHCKCGLFVSKKGVK